MASWPPSPSVEDEQSALAREHGVNHSVPESSDDQTIPSRGSLDQMPVIVDSSIVNNEPVADQAGSVSKTSSKRADSRPASTFSQQKASLPTPPPSDTEAARGRFRSGDLKTSSDSAQDTRSRSVVGTTESRQARPSILRLRTDVNESTKANSSSRRAPSPYVYTPESGTFRVDPASESSISDSKKTETPAPENGYRNNSSKQNRESRGYDSSTDSEHKPNKSLRFAEKHQGPAKPLQHAINPHTNLKIDRVKVQAYSSSYCGADARDQEMHTDMARGDGKRDPRREHRSRNRSRRSSSGGRESPSSSSAEETGLSDHLRSTKKSGSDGHFVQQRSSYRNERPRLDGRLSHQPETQHKLSNPEDDATRHVYRVSRSCHPMTPPAVTTPHHMEDYFSNAFRDNALKKGRHTLRSSTDDTAVFSPPTSPPRTPGSERPARQEYFGSPVSSPRRTPHHSRNPSLDETQVRELKARTSLLSQATTTAATIAITKTSPPLSKAATNAIETTFACSSNVIPSKPRSRASSPQRERLHRSDTFTYGDHAMPQVTYPPVPQSKRPSTRDGNPVYALPSHPQRTASWAGQEAQYTLHGAHYGLPTHAATNMNTVQSAQLTSAPQVQRSQSSSGPQDFLSKLDDFTLPPCPRSQPSQGMRDWSTFKDFLEPSICPKCTHALSFTRFRGQLIRARDKPYDRLTTCALSRPWIRLAVIESVKLNRSDLSLVTKASLLPEGARACEGNRSDIRTWWKLIDPSTDRAVPDFFVCSACVGSVHQIYPDLPDQFKRDVLNQEKVCGLREESRNFKALTDQLAEIAAKCRDRGKSSARYMQPFVDQVRRSTRYPECQRDTLSQSLAWHFAPDLPEFTMCERCYHEVVFPVEDKPFAQDIAKLLVLVPLLSTKGPIVNLTTAKGTSNIGTQLTSCQLYSDRMRRLFNDMVAGKISYDSFKAKVKERHATQYRLEAMNKLYEEDQKMGWDRRAEVEKNKAFWRSLE